MRRVLSGSILLLMAGGCANTDMFVQRQTALEGRLEQLAQSQNAALIQLAEMSTEVKGLQEQVRKLTGEQAVRQEMSEKLAGLTQRLDRIETDLPPQQATRIEVVNKGTTGEDRGGHEQDAYLKAFGLFSANNFPAAAEAFAAFIKNYPTSEHAVNARYWLGECLFSEGKLRQAVDLYGQIVTEFPTAPKTPDALLKMGLSLLGLNETAKGKSALQSLVEKYPASDAAGKAKERLNSL